MKLVNRRASSILLYYVIYGGDIKGHFSCNLLRSKNRWCNVYTMNLRSPPMYFICHSQSEYITYLIYNDYLRTSNFFRFWKLVLRARNLKVVVVLYNFFHYGTQLECYWCIELQTVGHIFNLQISRIWSILILNVVYPIVNLTIMKVNKLKRLWLNSFLQVATD